MPNNQTEINAMNETEWKKTADAQSRAGEAGANLTDVLERICNEVMDEYGMSFGGVYADFANEVARRAVILEREACAKVCEEVVPHPAGYGGQWEGYGPVKTQRDGKECAAAIRARSNIEVNGGAAAER